MPFIFRFVAFLTIANAVFASDVHSDEWNFVSISSGYGDIVHTRSGGFYVVEALYPAFRYRHVADINGSRVSYSRERFAHTEDGKLYFISRKIYEKKEESIFDSFKYPVEFLEIDDRLSKEEIEAYFSNGLVSGYHKKNGDIIFIGYHVKSVDPSIWRLVIENVQVIFDAPDNQISVILNPFEQRLSGSQSIGYDSHYLVLSTKKRSFFLKILNQNMTWREINTENVKASDENHVNLISIKDYGSFGENISLLLSDNMCAYTIDSLQEVKQVPVGLGNFLSFRERSVQFLHDVNSNSYFNSNNNLRRIARGRKILPCKFNSIISRELDRIEYYPLNSSFSVRRHCRKSSKDGTLRIARRFEDVIGGDGSPAGILLACVEEKTLHLFDLWNSWGSDHTIEDEEGAFSIKNKDVIAPCSVNRACPSSENDRIKVRYLGLLIVGD